MRFGMLTVVEDMGRVLYGSNWQAFLRCRCDCGRETMVPASSLLGHNTQSCGCMIKGRVAREKAHAAQSRMIERVNVERRYAYQKLAEAEAAGQTFMPLKRLTFMKLAVLAARESGEIDRFVRSERKAARKAAKVEEWVPFRPPRLTFENEHADDWMFGGVHIMKSHPPFGSARKSRKPTKSIDLC